MAHRADPDPSDPQLVAGAHQVLDTQHYAVLGTSAPDGPPRVSPVYFTHHRYSTLYWVSSPHATHSVNVRRTPAATLVVFDSSLPPARTRAVYLTGSAIEVPERELTDSCTVAFANLSQGAVPFAPEQLRDAASLRLYRFTADLAEYHVRGTDPLWGTGLDRRVPVTLDLG